MLILKAEIKELLYWIFRLIYGLLRFFVNDGTSSIQEAAHHQSTVVFAFCIATAKKHGCVAFMMMHNTLS